MDYGQLMEPSEDVITGYLELIEKFSDIALILTKRIQAFVAQGFRPENGYMMAHSFGSQLCLQAGRDCGHMLSGIDGTRTHHFYMRSSNYRTYSQHSIQPVLYSGLTRYTFRTQGQAGHLPLMYSVFIAVQIWAQLSVIAPRTGLWVNVVTTRLPHHLYH